MILNDSRFFSMYWKLLTPIMVIGTCATVWLMDDANEEDSLIHPLHIQIAYNCCLRMTSRLYISLLVGLGATATVPQEVKSYA